MRHPARREEFFFLGDHLALDFLNTRPVLQGQRKELLTGFPSLLRWFVHAHLIGRTTAGEMSSRWGHREEAGSALARILSFRESFRSAIQTLELSGKVPSRAIQELNALLKLQPVTFRVVKAGGRLAKRIHFPPTKPEDLIGILANLAADLLSEIEPRRIRKCQGCVLHFRDTTKNGTRRWCSMQACGNRAKVAAYTARKKRQQGA